MCMVGMAEGLEIWGAKHYKLSISLSFSIFFLGGRLLRHVPSPPPSFAGSYEYQRERESKKSKSEKEKEKVLYLQSTYSPCQKYSRLRC